MSSRRCASMRGLGLAALLGLIAFAASAASASGTYRPPPPPPGLGAVQRRDFVLGRALFEGMDVLGRSGKSCADCHGSDASAAFSRDALKRESERLVEKINHCIGDESRIQGPVLEPASEDLLALVSYLVTHYALPETVLQTLRRPAGKPAK
ncbi:MAG: hypothetical protein HYY25_02330 [Candidatus Wallbacteria bacterium]|nr:hypothetical protein [Candidatus Wallbacteria bacterium]